MPAVVSTPTMIVFHFDWIFWLCRHQMTGDMERGILITQPVCTYQIIMSIERVWKFETYVH